MEEVFTEIPNPSTRLFDCICILGLSVNSLRGYSHIDILLLGKSSGKPEIIMQLPPSQDLIKENHVEVI